MPVLFTRAPMAAESHSCSEMASSRERSRKAAASSSHGKALSRLSRFTAPPIASSARAHTSMRQDDSQVGRQIGRAHVRTPVTNGHLVCRPLLEKNKTHDKNT